MISSILMKEEDFVAVPVDLMNEILQYLTFKPYKEVHLMISRLSNECSSIHPFSEETEPPGETLPVDVKE